MKRTCPRCGVAINVGTRPVGSTISCQCGNTMVVPRKSSVPWWVILIIVAVLAVPCLLIAIPLAGIGASLFFAQSPAGEVSHNVDELSD